MATASASSTPSCPLCKAHHYLSTCSKFTSQSSTQRRELVKKHNRCFNCMSAAHSLQNCKSKFSCKTCGKRYHSMLHLESDSVEQKPAATVIPAAISTPSPCAEVTSLFASATVRRRSHVLLATARVRVRVDSGRSLTIRALLDQGSEATFISEHLAQSLRAKRISMPVSISAVGGVQARTVTPPLLRYVPVSRPLSRSPRRRSFFHLSPRTLLS